MRRIRLSACLAVLWGLPLAAQQATIDCDLSGQIVTALVQARADGADQTQAVVSVSQTLQRGQAAYQPAVAPLAQWVYSLARAQMDEDVPGAWMAACESQ